MCWDNGSWYVLGTCADEGAGRKPSVLETWPHWPGFIDTTGNLTYSRFKNIYSAAEAWPSRPTDA